MYSVYAHPFDVNIRAVCSYGVDGVAKFYDISGVVGTDRPVVPCFEAVFTVCDHYRHTQ